jgi:hypothetical protein
MTRDTTAAGAPEIVGAHRPAEVGPGDDAW